MYNEVFKALSDPTRREILRLLSGGERTAGELASSFDMTKPSMSHHFAVLKEADLIRSRRDGQQIYYCLNTTVLEDVLTRLWDHLGLKSTKGNSETMIRVYWTIGFALVAIATAASDLALWKPAGTDSYPLEHSRRSRRLWRQMDALHFPGDDGRNARSVLLSAGLVSQAIRRELVSPDVSLHHGADCRVVRVHARRNVVRNLPIRAEAGDGRSGTSLHRGHVFVLRD